MVKVKPKNVAKQSAFNPLQGRKRPVWGGFTLLFGILVLVAFLDYRPEQSSWVTTTVKSQNMIGSFGSTIAFWSLHLLGLAGWLLPLLLGWLSYMFFLGHTHKLGWVKAVWAIGALTSAASLGDMVEMGLQRENYSYFSLGLGGSLGNLVFGGLLKDYLGSVGSGLLLSVLFLSGIYLIIHDNIGSGADFVKKLLDLRRRKKEARVEELKQKETVSRGKTVAPSRPKKKDTHKAPKLAKRGPEATAETRDKVALKASKAVPGNKGGGEAIDTPLLEEPEPAVDDGEILIPRFSNTDVAATETPATGLSRDKDPLPGNGAVAQYKIIPGEKTEKASRPPLDKQGDYLFPPMDILSDPSSSEDSARDEDHKATASALVRTLSEFGVQVDMGEIHSGPVITRYDIHPAPGVRVEKIQNLDKNIALGLKTTTVRVIAPVPGKGCVGIEIPNKEPSQVCMREILESRDWADSNSEIPIALGKEVSGSPLVADLTRMPHLLIAGATGSGKTVCLNAVICSLLYHSSPEDLRFVMVDPKIVEMQGYNALPHMLIPVVTDPKKVPAALKYLINEMEGRYKIFATVGVRNIAGFNAKRQEDAASEQERRELEADLSPEERAAVSQIEVPRDEEIVIPEKLPYIVCIIDELADLMIVAPAEVETCIARLAQLARAAGIHLIIATQRPSVNVITGVIKANLPCRIAFKVASKVDSRTILDGIGADHLIGRGDMLFLPPGAADIVRSQGAFVSDEEITEIVEFLKSNGEPEFDLDFQMHVESGGDGEEEGDPMEGDELLPDALEVLRSTKRASTSMLQRRLRIGYNRAARIMEILEDQGIVGPDNGSQPREILKNFDSL